MPNTASAKKQLRQSEESRARNRAVKSSLRTQIRKIRESLKSGNLQATQAEFNIAARSLDKAASKGVIHANRAARLKSRISAAIKKLKAQQ
jgi:small subunit ribosomal protein S20